MNTPKFENREVSFNWYDEKDMIEKTRRLSRDLDLLEMSLRNHREHTMVLRERVNYWADNLNSRLIELEKQVKELKEESK